MTRNYFILLAALVFTGPAQGKELVKNGSFEQGTRSPDSWTGNKGTRWADGGKTGKCAVLGPGAWITWKQNIKKFRPNTSYIFTAWVKADRPALAQVLVDGIRPHKSGVNFFYMKADTEWRRWLKLAVGDQTSSRTVILTLLNEESDATIYFDDVSFSVREVDVKPVPIKPVEEILEGRENGDLISNGRFEIGDGDRPAGWYHHEPGLMPRTASDPRAELRGLVRIREDTPEKKAPGNYFFDPMKESGIYTWEKTGFSGRSARLRVPEGNGWGGWSTQVHDIKPHTKYTLEFWYRMSRKGTLRLFLFGKELVPQDMPELNPRHWWRYTATVYSGAESDDSNIGFVVEAGPDRKSEIWIDNVELFEGVSPIGMNAARLTHYYYDFSWISPDVVSPIPFAFEWAFEEDERPEEIGYVVELPEEVKVTGYYIGRLRHAKQWGSITWTNPDTTAQVEKDTVKINGAPYVRYTFYQKQVSSNDPKSFGKDGYVPVEIINEEGQDPIKVRNNWRVYTGTTALILYVLSTKEEGQIPPAYYHAAFGIEEQSRQKLTFRLTRIPEVPRTRKMALIAHHATWALDQNPQFIKDYARLGFTGSVIARPGHSSSSKDPANAGKVLKEGKQKGFRHVAMWTNIPSYRSKDTMAAAMGVDFIRPKKEPKKWCLEYRGPDWKKRLDGLKAHLDMGYNTFLFDDAADSTCFCIRCKRAFQRFLKEHSQLDYVSPSDFLSPDWDGEMSFLQFWEDFPLYHYGLTAKVMKEELTEYARERGLPDTIYFGVSSLLHYKNPVAAASLDVFDFNSQQTYIYYSLNWLKGSPRRTGDVLLETQNRLGDRARPLVPTISPGLGYMSQLCSLDPHEQMKYQILEMMMAPKALGYTVYAGNDFDLGDMKYTAEANAILARFENIITDGEIIPDLTVQGTKQSTIRAKKLGAEILVLVSDYSTYDPVNTELSFSFPQTKSLVDVETGQAIKPTADGIYRIALKERRLRMLYSGPKGR